MDEFLSTLSVELSSVPNSQAGGRRYWIDWFRGIRVGIEEEPEHAGGVD